MNRVILEFILFNVIFLSFIVFLTYYLYNYILKKKKKDTVSFSSYINQGNIPPIKSVIVGLIFGIVFGFIDNFGLWMGLNHIEKYLPGGLLTKSGIGNIYSDFIGVVLGTSISIIAKELIDYNNDDQPLWVNTIGIVIGCILGMFIGILLTGKN